MSQNSPATHIDEDRHNATRATFERRLALLAWLVEIGRACVRAAGRRAAAGTPGVKAGRAAGAFDRMSRAVRLTIALARHTFEMFKAWRLAPDALADILDEPDEAEARVADAEDRPETENLTDYEDLNEFRWLTMTEQEEFARILKKPFEEIVARICKDLGVKFDRQAWADGAEPEAVFDADPSEVEPETQPGDAKAPDLSVDLSAEAHRAKTDAPRDGFGRSLSGGP